MAKRFINGDELVAIKGADGSAAIGAGYVGEKVKPVASSALSPLSTTNGGIVYTDVAVPNGVWLVTYRMYATVSSTTTTIQAGVTTRSVAASGDVESSGSTWNLGSARLNLNMFVSTACEYLVVTDGYIRVWAAQYGTSLLANTPYFIYSLTRMR
jgi:hypothetical protein